MPGTGMPEGFSMSLHMLTAHTTEVDDVDGAVEDVLGQLNIEHNLLRHAVGMLFCNRDFIESGVVRALCARLPFEVVGCTTQGIVMPREMGGIMLGLAVLTSDTVAFSTGLSEPLTRDTRDRLSGAYRQAAARLDAKPSMIFACQPMLDDLAGATVIDALDRASGGVPVFGTIAVDMLTQSLMPMTIHNGSAYRDRFALLLLAGDIDARFFVEWFPGERKMSASALITRAEGNKIVEINNLPALDYMARLGMADDGYGAMYLMPFIITAPDGRRKTVACTAVTGKTLVCGDIIPPGCTMNFGEATNEDVLESATRVVHEVKQAFPAGEGREETSSPPPPILPGEFRAALR